MPVSPAEPISTVVESKRRRFFRTYPLLYHKVGNMAIFRSGNLYSLCSPGNYHYQKIIYFINFFIKKGRNRRSKFDNQEYDYIMIH